VAIASVGSLGTGAGSGAGSTVVITTTAQLDAGNVGLLVVVCDNTSTSDGETSEVSSVADSAGNNWVKQGEYCNGNGAAGAGIVTSVWMTRAGSTLASGGTITATLAAASKDRCASAWEFTSGSGLIKSITNINNVVDASNGFGSVSPSGMPSKSRLFFRGLGKEANSTTALTPTASWTAITATRSRNNTNAVLVRGEFRINTSTGETSNPTMAVSGDTAGVLVTLEEAFSGTAGVSASNATASGSATFAGAPTGTAAVSTQSATASGSASFQQTTRTGTAAVTASNATASGTAMFGFAHPVGRLTRSVTALGKKRAGSFADKPFSPPLFFAGAAVTITAATGSGIASYAHPHPVGRLTRSVSGLGKRRTGTFLGKGGHAGEAAVTVSSTTAAGTAVVTDPFYTGTAAVTSTSATATGSAATAPPIVIGQAVVTIANATAAGSATVSAPVYTGTGIATVTKATASGTAIFASAVYSGVGQAIASPATASGAAVFTSPVYTAAAAVTVTKATAQGLTSGGATPSLDRVVFTATIITRQVFAGTVIRRQVFGGP
jgi:hypothetical protein